MQLDDLRNNGLARQMKSGGVVGIVLSASLAAFCIAIFVEYKDAECDKPLATFLLVLGIALVVVSGFNFCVARNSDEVERDCATSVAAVGTLFQLFVFAWFIVGNVWTFNTDDTKCQRTLYLSSFWVIVGQYILGGVLFLLFCCAFVCGAAAANAGSGNRQNFG